MLDAQRRESWLDQWGEAEAGATPVVQSYNEWDPLEEVIVGRVDGATIPPSHVSVDFGLSPKMMQLRRLVAGRRYPGWMIAAARRELDGFVRLLEGEGVTVRRPDPLDGRRKYASPFWSSRGFCTTCPRDGFLVVGDEIIETPMAWRCRYFEALAYRSLFKAYFRQGARWTAAPKPALADDIYDPGYVKPADGEPLRYVVTEAEPVLDAADCARCGRDIFVMRSNVTNDFGVEWLRRHLGERYRVHVIWSKARSPMHVDTTFIPLAPGKLLVNPDFLDMDRLPPILRGWDILVAPPPDPVGGWAGKLSMCSAWISLNVLMLDTKRVVVDASQPTLIRALRDWGFEPLPLPFMSYGAFGGAFHCATLDIRRRGGLQSYF